MRNYIPVQGDPALNTPMAYVFNEFVCCFTGETLAKELKARADAYEASPLEAAEVVYKDGTTADPIDAKVVDAVRTFAKGVTARVARDLRFIADNLPADATYELPALAVNELCSRLLSQAHQGEMMPLPEHMIPPGPFSPDSVPAGGSSLGQVFPFAPRRPTP